ncbi:putative F-box protein At5g62660 [Papaver somniferum]|uniref:putative F-box protein At5g62660 n=1 Tax=Papaver somniferum TaxID=3469 RepID=UPI000E6FEAC5|nr:putative F-box protein At5g62660 [Papaver somniferum]
MNNNDSESLKETPVLPHDIIIYDILTRLPLESVVRFTCVCKLWSKLLLNNKKFANLHQRRNSPSSSPPGIIDYKFDKNTRKCYLSLFDVDKSKRRIVRFKPETDYRVDNMEIKQSFNGLLLFCRCVKRNSVYDYIVYNPITGRSVNLPVPDGIGLHNCEFCLGYDPVGENYKSVCFGNYDDKYFCKILTLGEFGRDSWRNLVKPGFGFNTPFSFVRNGVVFSIGVLYWISDGTEEPKTVKKTIYSIDLTTETLYTTKIPNDASQNVDFCNLVEMGGLLCYYELNHKDKLVKLWVLKKNIDNQCEWVRERNIELAKSFQNAVGVLSYEDFKYNCHLIEIVTNPKPKIIFMWYGAREVDDEDALLSYEYYSCDVELNKIELILGSKMDGKGDWHVNSIAYL